MAGPYLEDVPFDGSTGMINADPDGSSQPQKKKKRRKRQQDDEDWEVQDAVNSIQQEM